MDDAEYQSLFSGYDQDTQDPYNQSPGDQSYDDISYVSANDPIDWGQQLEQGSSIASRLLEDVQSPVDMGGKSAFSVSSILNQKGDTVGAMLLKMALSGIANVSAQRTTNNRLALEREALDLSREKERRASGSMHGVSTGYKKNFGGILGAPQIKSSGIIGG